MGIDSGAQEATKGVANESSWDRIWVCIRRVDGCLYQASVVL